MSKGLVCRCDERDKPLAERQWGVIDRNCNHSAFSGYHYTPSDYSAVVCLDCCAWWRTKAGYVAHLKDAVPTSWGWGWAETKGGRDGKG